MFWDLGIENIIRNKMFKNPAWTALRGTQRGLGDKACWYGADDAVSINQACGGMLFHPDNSAYEIGFDFGQIFTFKNHSSGMFCIR